MIYTVEMSLNAHRSLRLSLRMYNCDIDRLDLPTYCSLPPEVFVDNRVSIILSTWNYNILAVGNTLLHCTRMRSSECRKNK